MITHISAVNSISPKYISNNFKSAKAVTLTGNCTVPQPFCVQNYNVNFTGLSLPRDYSKTSDYIAAYILDRNRSKYGVDGSQISSKNIKDVIERLFKSNKVYLPFTLSEVAKVKWKSYIPQDIREFSINKVNDARIDRFNTWKTYLENPIAYEQKEEYKPLSREIQNDNCLKFLIWNAINSEIKINNRHIPVPFDIKALSKTIQWFNSISSEDRRIQIPSEKEFLNIYTHKLKDELLMSRPELLTTQEYIPDANAYWVRIPSLKKDRKNASKNIAALEILSNENWCTRSSVDKAEAALMDGDFYIYLRRAKDSQVWQTVLGMTSYKGAIDQIQGANNDNLIPLKELDNIKNFITQNNLKYISGASDEGPKALQQILISEALKTVDKESGLSLSAAIYYKDNYTIFKILNFGAKEHYATLKDYVFRANAIEIDSYKPCVVLDVNKGIKVPLTFLNIVEDELLSNVRVIHGNFVLTDAWESEITHFPKNLQKVEGKIICTQEQYMKFKDDMLKVIDSPNKIIIKK